MVPTSKNIAVWNDAIEREKRNIELFNEIRDHVAEIEENHKIIANNLRVGLALTFTTAPTANIQELNKSSYKTSTPTPNPKGSKTEFVTACFLEDMRANPKEIDDRWVQSGGEGHISPSLVYKTKHDMNKKIGKNRKRNIHKNIESDPDITKAQQVIWDLLNEKPMTTGELYTAICTKKLLDPMPKNLEETIRIALDDLRSSGKVSRGTLKRYGIVSGVNG